MKFLAVRTQKECFRKGEVVFSRSPKPSTKSQHASSKWSQTLSKNVERLHSQGFRSVLEKDAFNIINILTIAPTWGPQKLFVWCFSMIWVLGRSQGPSQSLKMSPRLPKWIPKAITIWQKIIWLACGGRPKVDASGMSLKCPPAPLSSLGYRRQALQDGKEAREDARFHF